MAVYGLPAQLSEFCTARTVSEGDELTVWLEGEVDVCAAPRLHELLCDPGAHAASDVVVDMSGVTFCDAHGLRVLISATEIRHARGATLTVRGAPPTLLRMTELLKVERRLQIAAAPLKERARACERKVAPPRFG